MTVEDRSLRGPAARRLVLLSVLAMVFALVPWAGVAGADPEDHVAAPGDPGDIVERGGDGLVPTVRFRGVDRYDTANLIATDNEPSDPAASFLDAGEVLLARGDLFPDALSGNYLAGLVDGPMLLTTTEALPPDTVEALETIDPETVTILGGTDAVSAAVETELGSMGFAVRRFGGLSRYETAVEIAEQGGPYGLLEGQRTAIVASGDEFPDALVAGAVSFDSNFPLLLSFESRLNEPTEAALEDLDIERVLLLGGTARLAPQVQDDIEALGIDVDRIFGADRVETAIDLALFTEANLGWTQAHVQFARGDLFPDALTIGPHAGTERSVLLLANSPTLLDGPDNPVEAYLESQGCEFEVIHLAGGYAALSEEVEAEIRAAATAEGEACNIDLTPESATNLVGESHTVTATVTDNGGEGVEGVEVTFVVDNESGTVVQAPETGTVTDVETGTVIVDPQSGTATTDEDGEADFTFVGLTPGTVTVTACFTNSDGEEVCDTVTKVFTTQPLLDAVTVPKLMDHLEALMECAALSGGNREASGLGYQCSVEYVRDQLLAAGYSESQIEETFFDFTVFTEIDSEFAQVAPNPETYTNLADDPDGDYGVMSFSGSGNVDAPVTLVDADLGPGNPGTGEPNDGDSDSGCEADDFIGFTAGHIALIQRGSCSFAQKATNAEAAGAAGVIIFNQLDGAPAFFGTLGGVVSDTLPVIGTSFEVGFALAEADETGDDFVHLMVASTNVPGTSSNLTLKIEGYASQGAVGHGSHLDSVAEGPGINDPGSGAVALLQTAIEYQNFGVSPRNDTWFMWWGAEESGLIGSTCWVFGGCGQDLVDGKLVLPDFSDLTPLGYEFLAGGYLNYDMIASPNYARFVYDGDGSGFGLTGPPGSAAMEHNYTAFFDDLGLFSEPTAFSGRSDYQAFINVGIAAGGLFTGAEGIKTPEQEAIYGGDAGEQYDPCYHLACDSMVGGSDPDGDNIDETVYAQNSASLAHHALVYSFATDSIHGDEGVETVGKAAPGSAGVSFDYLGGHLQR